MRALERCKDGGVDSPVDAYFLIEWKGLFSIALLKFNMGGRESYHTHAFDAYTCFLFGDLEEEDFNGSKYKYTFNLLPKFTPKAKNHRVVARRDSWCFTLRGRWQDTWTEDNKDTGKHTTFTHGRVEV